MRIRITAGKVSMEAALAATPTARAVWDALPINASARRWGEEIYFEIPVALDPEPDATETVNLGDVAYWPPGQAFCVFFGPTPSSDPGEIRAASAVNIFGRLLGDPRDFRAARSGTKVRVERVAE